MPDSKEEIAALVKLFKRIISLILFVVMDRICSDLQLMRESLSISTG